MQLSSPQKYYILLSVKAESFLLLRLPHHPFKLRTEAISVTNCVVFFDAPTTLNIIMDVKTILTINNASINMDSKFSSCKTSPARLIRTQRIVDSYFYSSVQRPTFRCRIIRYRNIFTSAGMFHHCRVKIRMLNQIIKYRKRPSTAKLIIVGVFRSRHRNIICMSSISIVLSA